MAFGPGVFVMHWKVLCAGVAVLAVAGAGVAQATTYDVAADFSPVNNPNGVWSYGHTSTGDVSFTLNSSHGTETNCPEVQMWIDNTLYLSQQFYNPTAVEQTEPAWIAPGNFHRLPGLFVFADCVRGLRPREHDPLDRSDDGLCRLDGRVYRPADGAI